MAARPLEFKFVSMRYSRSGDEMESSLSVPKSLLNRPEKKAIHSVLAPFIFYRSRMSEVRAYHLDDLQGARCTNFNDLKKARPRAIAIKNITTYMNEMRFNKDLIIAAHAMQMYTNSTETILYFVDYRNDEIYQCPLDLTEENHQVRSKIGPGTTLAAYVAYSKEYVLTNDIVKGSTYKLGSNKKDSCAMYGLCIPVLAPQTKELIAVIEMSKCTGSGPFTDTHLEVCLNICGWIGNAIFLSHREVVFQKETVLYDYLQQLLRVFITESIPLRHFMSEVLTFGRMILNAASSLFYILTHFGYIQGSAGEFKMDMYVSDGQMHYKKMNIGMNTVTSVATEVMRRSKLLNVDKEELLTKYNTDIYKPMAVTSSIAVPVMGQNSITWGVIEIINKKDSRKFTPEDVRIFKNITAYCDFALSYYKLQDECNKLSSFVKQRDDMLKLQLEPCIHNKQDMMWLDEEEPSNLYDLGFFPADTRVVYLTTLCDYLLKSSMMLWRTFSFEKRSRFLLMVAKATRTAMYTNFRRSFYCLHSLVCLLRKYYNWFPEDEQEEMLFAALCHDVNVPKLKGQLTGAGDLPDFPGVDNEHSSSFYYTKLIFKTCEIYDDTDVFESRMRTVSVMIHSCYHKNMADVRNALYELVEERKFDWDCPEHKFLLKKCIMCVCSHATFYKPFIIAIADMLRRFQQTAAELISVDGKINRYEISKTKMLRATRGYLQWVVLPWTYNLGRLLPGANGLYSISCEHMENLQYISYQDFAKYWIPELSIQYIENEWKAVMAVLDSSDESDESES